MKFSPSERGEDEKKMEEEEEGDEWNHWWDGSVVGCFWSYGCNYKDRMPDVCPIVGDSKLCFLVD